MKTFTFNTIYDSNFEEVGLSGYDLARAQRLTKIVLPSFVISNEIFENFFKDLKNKPYSELRKIIAKKEFSEEELIELKESYEALNVNIKGKTLLDDGEPVVNLFLSPNYASNNPSSRGVLYIQGFNQFLDALKTCWLKLFEPQEVELRNSLDIKKFSAGVVVQKYFVVEATFEAYTSENITFSAYKGLPDVTLKATKDFITVNDDLQEESYNVGTQEYKLTEGDNSGELLKVYLKNKSVDRKVELQDVSEAARIVKRLKTAFGKDISAVLVKTKHGLSISYVESLKEVEPVIDDTVLKYTAEAEKTQEKTSPAEEAALITEQSESSFENDLYKEDFSKEYSETPVGVDEDGVSEEKTGDEVNLSDDYSYNEVNNEEVVEKEYSETPVGVDKDDVFEEKIDGEVNLSDDYSYGEASNDLDEKESSETPVGVDKDDVFEEKTGDEVNLSDDYSYGEASNDLDEKESSETVVNFESDDKKDYSAVDEFYKDEISKEYDSHLDDKEPVLDFNNSEETSEKEELDESNDLDEKEIDSEKPSEELINSEEDSFEGLIFDDIENSEKKEEVSDDDFILSSVEESKPSLSDDLLSLEASIDEKLSKMYKDSFGFEPANMESAILDLDMKHGLDYTDELLALKRLRSKIDSGESTEEELEGVLASAREFLD